MHACMHASSSSQHLQYRYATTLNALFPPDILTVSVIVFNSTYAVGVVELSHIKDFFMAHIHSGAKGINGCVMSREKQQGGMHGRLICMARSTQKIGRPSMVVGAGNPAPGGSGQATCTVRLRTLPLACL